ncbi:hypothetical protein [Chryseobacterium sp. Alg-005]|uniref:hypothetical protein n=1 Tax=Chryseobacterium sp. Alg-005 TaxID=3159516 RepID=UPI0036F39201
MNKILFLLPFIGIYFQAQTTDQQVMEEQALLEKCKKQYGEEKCLSDTDNDKIPFYWDKNPEKAGTVATDALEPFKKKCETIYQQDKTDLENFKLQYKDIGKIYDQINKNILDDLPEESFTDTFIFIYFMDKYSCDLVGSCCSTLATDEHNYLISKFWNKSALENLTKYKRTITLSTKLEKDEKEKFLTPYDPELKVFLLKNYNPQYNIVKIQSKNKDENPRPIAIQLMIFNPYKLQITYLNQIKTYEYDGEKWTIQKQ